MNRLIEFFGRQGVFSFLLTIFIFVIGFYSLSQIRREVMPNVVYDIITVKTVYLGASPEEIEKLITNVIEQDLKEVDGIKEIGSSSSEGLSMIVLKLDPDQTDSATAKADIQVVIDQITNLPEAAEDPVVTSIETKFQPIIQVSLSGPVNEIELRKMAKQLEKEIELIPDVARVVYRGLRDLEIRVEADPKKLEERGVSLEQLINAIKRQNVSIPGGTIDPPISSRGAREKIVRTVGEFSTPEDVENTVVRANDLGEAIRVRDLAKISYDLEKADVLSRTAGNPAIGLTILKKEQGDAISMVDEVKLTVDRVKQGFSKDITIEYIDDFSYYIRRRLNILSNNLLVGLVLVLLVLSLILPFRVAILVSIGIPFGFLGTLFLFDGMGASLNLLTLLGLIMVVGMLVDDAVVVTENAVRRIEEGEDPQEAAIRGTQQVWSAVTTSVMTTIVVFIPLASMSGIMGKFVQFIPVGVIAALAISLFECFFILPHHIGLFVRRQKRAESRSRNPLTQILAWTESLWDRTAVPSYLKVLKTSIKHRYLMAFLSFVLFFASVAMAIYGMKFILFPPDGVELFYVRAEAPIGTSLKHTERLMRPIEKLVQELPAEEMDNFITQIGIQQQPPPDPNTKRGSHLGQIAIYLTPEQNRDRKAKEIIDGLRDKIGEQDSLKLTFARLNPGPPVGKPISVGIRGQTYQEIMPLVKEVQTFVESLDGATDVENNYTEGKEEIRVLVDPVEAAAAGLDVTSIGNSVRAAYDGIIATYIRELDEEIAVRVTWPKKIQSTSESIDQIVIPNASGNLVPLNRVAKTERKTGLSLYTHGGFQREVKVLGEVDETVTSAQIINNAIKAQVPQFKEKYPTLSFEFGGEEKDTQESLVSLVIAFIAAIMGIFLILVLKFKNLRYPILILSTVPLGIIAVIWAFRVHNMPLTFMGLLGVVALAGVIVNNAIVFLDFVVQAREQGLDRIASIMEAGRTRIRPIFLTTVTTVAGILPTAYGWGGLDQFVVPIALALGWGMFFGSILATVLFPAALAIFDDFLTVSYRLTGWQIFHDESLKDAEGIGKF